MNKVFYILLMTPFFALYMTMRDSQLIGIKLFWLMFANYLFFSGTSLEYWDYFGKL